jgi:Mor family transcriptional regulator
MSETLIRNLAEACAPKIAPHVEAAVQSVVREHLPGVLMNVLREMSGTGEIRLYAPKITRAERKARSAAIRDRYNGRNAAELAREYGLHPKAVIRIGNNKG